MNKKEELTILIEERDEKAKKELEKGRAELRRLEFEHKFLIYLRRVLIVVVSIGWIIIIYEETKKIINM